MTEARAVKVQVRGSKDVTVDIVDVRREGYNEPGHLMSFVDTHAVLEAWVGGAPQHRNFRYGGAEDDLSPDLIHLAWVQPDGTLAMSTIDPYWDGVDTRNAYLLGDLVAEVPHISWEEQS